MAVVDGTHLGIIITHYIGIVYIIIIIMCMAIPLPEATIMIQGWWLFGALLSMYIDVCVGGIVGGIVCSHVCE